MGEIALAQDFHSDDGFTGGFHTSQNPNYRFGISVHVGADGVDAGKIDFNPWRGCGGPQSFDAVAGASVGANDSLLLGIFEDVHNAAVAGGPIGLGEAMHEADVEVVGAEFATEAVEIGAGGGGIAGPSFGEDGNSVARDMFEGFGDVRMAPVGIGGVEETEAAVVTVEEKIGKAFDAERGLV